MVDGLGEGAARKNRQMLVGKGHEDQMLGKEQVRDMQKQRKGFNINQNHVSFIRRFRNIALEADIKDPAPSKWLDIVCNAQSSVEFEEDESGEEASLDGMIFGNLQGSSRF